MNGDKYCRICGAELEEHKTGRFDPQIGMDEKRKIFHEKVLHWLKINDVKFERFRTIDSKRWGLEARVFFGSSQYVPISPADFEDEKTRTSILENEIR